MYQPTIGLEVHAELKTKTKMFCGCVNNPDEKRPNFNVCQVCLGHPGALPFANKKAIEAVLKAGIALNSRIPERSKFDRKNYFYPDLPKGYQISQYDEPLCSGGYLDIFENRRIKLTRIHLEEDTGRLIHSNDGKSSLVDFNRAGLPLMELVTEPDIKNGKEAVAFAKEFQLILKYLGISDADMEKGQMRVEANISVSKDENLGTKVEIKNLNSFRAVEESIDYEIKRQKEILETGNKVTQETRGWDENKKSTFPQRKKEEAHDYRYFPEPDLPPLDIKGFRTDELKMEIPELPEKKRGRFLREYNLSREQSEVLISDLFLADYFEEAVSELKSESPDADCQLLFNYLTSDLKGLMNESNLKVTGIKITPENFADLITMIIKGEILSKTAKEILKEMMLTGDDPRNIIKEKELGKIFDNDIIKETAVSVLKDNIKAVEDYKKGKDNVMQFLIGQAMAKLKGRGDPEKLKNIFRELINYGRN